ncbi:MAG: hypothetical protein CL912_16905 [Deltaproteobacteria bacterium]|nr:hypothetical protein [Deltaproteobacteria bacterium]
MDLAYVKLAYRKAVGEGGGRGRAMRENRFGQTKVTKIADSIFGSGLKVTASISMELCFVFLVLSSQISIKGSFLPD